MVAGGSRSTGREAGVRGPTGVSQIVTTPAALGFNGVLNPTKVAVLNAFKHGCQRVAVLAWRNDDVAKLRDYLSRSRLFPHHVGGSDDFEEAREVIEGLGSIGDSWELALRVVDKIAQLVPTLPGSLRHQVERRLGRSGANRKGCTRQAAILLDAIEPVYSHGPAYFFRAVWDGLRACTRRRATTSLGRKQLGQLATQPRRWLENRSSTIFCGGTLLGLRRRRMQHLGLDEGFLS